MRRLQKACDLVCNYIGNFHLPSPPPDFDKVNPVVAEKGAIANFEPTYEKLVEDHPLYSLATHSSARIAVLKSMYEQGVINIPAENRYTIEKMAATVISEVMKFKT